MKEYKGLMIMKPEDFDYYNELLLVDFNDNSENMISLIEKLNAKREDNIGISTSSFSDDNYIKLSIVSDNNNYYYKIILFDEAGNILYVYDKTYILGDNIIMDYAEASYNIEIKISEEDV